MDIGTDKRGHMGMLVWTNESGYATWCNCVAVNVFDDRVEFIKSDNQGSYVHVVDTSEDEHLIIGDKKKSSYFTMLTKNGQPAVSKNTIFGEYTFKTT